MKKVLFLLTCISFNYAFGQLEVIPVFVEKWDNSKNYLLEVAQAMPQDKYDFKPTEREMSFREHLNHILDNMNWLSVTCFSNQKYAKIKWKKDLTKAQILAEINTHFELAKKPCPEG